MVPLGIRLDDDSIMPMKERRSVEFGVLWECKVGEERLIL